MNKKFSGLVKIIGDNNAFPIDPKKVGSKAFKGKFNMSGLMIPKYTSTIVITDRIPKTIQILFKFDSCACAIFVILFYELNQVEKGKYKYPN